MYYPVPNKKKSVFERLPKQLIGVILLMIGGDQCEHSILVCLPDQTISTDGTKLMFGKPIEPTSIMVYQNSGVMVVVEMIGQNEPPTGPRHRTHV